MLALLSCSVHPANAQDVVFILLAQAQLPSSVAQTVPEVA